MLCTKCSEHLKPVVALDIDGTLGDYHLHFFRFADDYMGGSFVKPRLWKPYGGIEKFSDYCMDIYDIDLRTYRDIKLAYRQGARKRSMPVLRGAVPLCHAVVHAGAELWLTTTRPYLRLDNIDPDTRFWLERNGIEYDGLMYDEDKYAVLADRLDPARVVAVVDDETEQINRAVTVWGKTIPIQAVGNYNIKALSSKPHFSGDLESIGHEIVHRVNIWKGQHL